MNPTPPPRRGFRRTALVAALVAACAPCAGCFTALANTNLGDGSGGSSLLVKTAALGLDIVTAPIQIAVLAGYGIHCVVEEVSRPSPPTPKPQPAVDCERKTALAKIRRDPACVRDATYVAEWDGLPTPHTLAFAEALRDPEIRFPPDILEAAVERLRAVPQAIPAFAPIFARPELDSAALERLRPTVEEWSRDWSRDCAREFARNPNLAPSDAPPPEPPATSDSLLAALRDDPTLVLKDSVFWSASGPEARAALSSLLADESVPVPDRVLVFLGTILLGGGPDAEALLLANADGRLADPVALRRALAAELARRAAELDAHEENMEEDKQ